VSLFLSLVIAGILVGALYGLVGFSLTLMFRSTGVLSFAHAGFALVAAYLYAGFSCNAGSGGAQCGNPILPPFAAAFVSILATAVLALAVERLVIRPLQGASSAVKSIATAAVLGLSAGAMLQVYGPQPRAVPLSQQLVTPGGFRLGDVVVNYQQASIFVVSLVLIAALTAALRGSWFGLGVRMAGQRPEVARLMGVNPVQVARFNWAVAGVLSGVAGVLVAPITVVNTGTFSFLLVKAVGATLIGGLVSLPATFLGGILLGIVEAVLPRYWQVTGAADVGVAVAVCLGLFVHHRRLAVLARTAHAHERSDDRPVGGAALTVAKWLVAGQRAGRRVPAAVWLTLALGVLSFPLRDDYWGAVGLNVIFYVLMALSVLFVTGLTGEPSLMQMAFAGIGAYSVAYCLGRGLPFAVGVLAGMAVSFAIALAVGWAALRFRGVAFAVFSLALGAPISTWLLGQRWLRNDIQSPDFFGLDLLKARTAFVVFAVTTGLLLVLVRGLLRSSWGRSLRAVEDGHSEILRHAGVSPTRTEVVVFGFSGAVAALGGAVYALIVGSFTTFQFIPLVSISILLAGFIGGLRSLWGPIITGVIFGYGPVLLSSFGSERANAYPQIVGSALALVLVVWAPRGLSSIFAEARDAVSRRQGWAGTFRGPALSLAALRPGQEVAR